MLACSALTPAGAAHVAGATPHTSLIVALFSAAFAMGAWARAGLYCNHQVCVIIVPKSLGRSCKVLLSTDGVAGAP